MNNGFDKYFFETEADLLKSMCDDDISFVKQSSSAKKRKVGDTVGDSSNTNKKRFVWPDALHKQFISAVFDTGLKFATIKDVNYVLPSNCIVSLDQVKAYIQKFRFYRDCDQSTGLRKAQLSSYELMSQSAESYEKGGTVGVESQFSDIHPTAPPTANILDHLQFPSASLQQQQTLLQDSTVGFEKVDHAVIDSLRFEVESIGRSIAAQTEHLQELQQAILNQMRIHQSLLDTLAQLDPQQSYTAHTNSGFSGVSGGSCDVAHLNGGQSGPLAGTSAQTYSCSSLQLPHHPPLFSQWQQDSTEARQPQQDHNQDSGFQTDNFSSHLTPNGSNTGKSSVSHSEPLCSGSLTIGTYNSNTNSAAGNGGAPLRTELHAISEMRAQMHLHRRLVEWKQDQVAVSALTGGTSTDAFRTSNSDTQQAYDQSKDCQVSNKSTSNGVAATSPSVVRNVGLGQSASSGESGSVDYVFNSSSSLTKHPRVGTTDDDGNSRNSSSGLPQSVGAYGVPFLVADPMSCDLHAFPFTHEVSSTPQISHYQQQHFQQQQQLLDERHIPFHQAVTSHDAPLSAVPFQIMFDPTQRYQHNRMLDYFASPQQQQQLVSEQQHQYHQQRIVYQQHQLLPPLCASAYPCSHTPLPPPPLTSAGHQHPSGTLPVHCDVERSRTVMGDCVAVAAAVTHHSSGGSGRGGSWDDGEEFGDDLFAFLVDGTGIMGDTEGEREEGSTVVPPS